ncbi:MAG: nuclease-related domain-containing protein [Pseudomonadota bacterium]|nr:nuclease-related domain-containing protein [Pseudomonadota bacterium]
MNVKAFSGKKNEKDVAFHLKRAFLDRSDVEVFNDLQIVVDGESAQIDHLILHKYGFIIVESKSVKGEVNVNAHGEWSRSYQGKWFGIPSPIQQAENQQKILKMYLKSRDKDLLGKLLGLQKGFGGRTYDVLVALSSSALIRRDEIPEDINNLIAKADQIPAKVEDLIKKYKFSVLKLDTRPAFTDKEMQAISNELKGLESAGSSNVEAVEALEPKAPEKKEAKEKHKSEEKRRETSSVDARWALACKKCNETKGLVAKYGKFGYYTECPKCHTNTAMKSDCSACGSKKTKVRKSKHTYALECQDCQGVSKITVDSEMRVMSQ